MTGIDHRLPPIQAQRAKRASLGLGQLFGRQGDASHGGPIVPGEGQRHATPTAADVEYRQAGPVQAELGGDVTLLGLLRFFKRFSSLREIGAGVLPIPIEEQAAKRSCLRSKSRRNGSPASENGTGLVSSSASLGGRNDAPKKLRAGKASYYVQAPTNAACGGLARVFAPGRRCNSELSASTTRVFDSSRRLPDRGHDWTNPSRCSD
jgi:hypothetical protein